MILLSVLRLDINRAIPFHFGNASLSIVEFTPRGPRLALLNDTCHLDGDLDS
jgi:broad specificity phosphatase PhoE